MTKTVSCPKDRAEKQLLFSVKRRKVNSVFTEPESVYLFTKRLRSDEQKTRSLSELLSFVFVFFEKYLRRVSSLPYQFTDDDAAMRRIIRSFRLHLCASQCNVCVRYWIPSKILERQRCRQFEETFSHANLLLISVCCVTNRV